MATTKNIQSIERASKIIDSFLKNGQMEQSLSEIAENVGLAKTTTFGIVNTLYNIGYLNQNEETGKYFLSLKFTQISNSLPTQKLTVEVVRPELINLNHEVNETIHFATREENFLIYLEKVEQRGSISMNTMVGGKNFLHCTGVGKCLLAYTSQDEYSYIISQGLTKLTKNTIDNPDDLANELEVIRNRGYAIDNEEISIGLKCMAVPVFKNENSVEYAISASGFVSRIDEAIEEGLYDKMLNTSKVLSEELYNYRY